MKFEILMPIARADEIGILVWDTRSFAHWSFPGFW